MNSTENVKASMTQIFKGVNHNPNIEIFLKGVHINNTFASVPVENTAWATKSPGAIIEVKVV